MGKKKAKKAKPASPPPSRPVKEHVKVGAHKSATPAVRAPAPANPPHAPAATSHAHPHPPHVSHASHAPARSSPQVNEGPRLEALPSTGPGRASTGGPKSGVVVVGSLNMDLVVRTEIMPAPGQTVMGQDLLQSPGGKGANQAAAVGRLWQKRSAGAKLIGRIGDDLFGQNVLAALAKSKVDTASVLNTKNTPTGTAMIMVDRHAENAIVVAGGANRHLSATDLLAQRKTIESSVVLLAQLEIPADTVACAIALAKRSNVLTILDPAPAPAEGLLESLYHVDIFTPNQTEAHLLTGIVVRNVDDARRAAEKFLLRGTRIVVMKMGSQGAIIVQRTTSTGATAPASIGIGGMGGAAEMGRISVQHIPGFRVPAVDPTAAGDAFTGALAVGLAEGMTLPAAVRFANAAGALACMKIGALVSIPTRAEVDGKLNEM